MLEAKGAVSRGLATGFAVAAVAGLGAVPAAFAAGSGYITPPTGTSSPTGFGNVAVAKTIAASKSGSVSAAVGHGTATVSVPSKATASGVEVALVKGDYSTAKSLRASSLKSKSVIGSFGVVLKKGSSSATVKKPLTLTFSKSSIKKGDVVAIFKGGKFVKLASAKVSKGKVTIKLTATEYLEVLS